MNELILWNWEPKLIFLSLGFFKISSGIFVISMGDWIAGDLHNSRRASVCRNITFSTVCQEGHKLSLGINSRSFLHWGYHQRDQRAESSDQYLPCFIFPKSNFPQLTLRSQVLFFCSFLPYKPTILLLRCITSEVKTTWSLACGCGKKRILLTGLFG